MWNCGRGLVQEGFLVKLNEIKQFLESKKPHCFGIIESDLFGPQSQNSRVKYTTEELTNTRLNYLNVTTKLVVCSIKLNYIRLY